MDELTLMEPPIQLSERTLARLPDGVLRPRYDRAALAPGIVHVGVGNFHRAHQAWYLHRLMQEGHALDWAVVGAGVRPPDAVMRERLLDQDCLTTLIELDPAARTVEVVGSMIDYVPVEAANGALVAAMADPRIRIVSLTVTEGGYYRDEAGVLDAAHPDIAHDIASPGAPRTAFGAMVSALAARRGRGHGAFTGLSCDNVQGNGDALRAAVLGIARGRDAGLADWIEAQVAFPNSMVDCIVPATGPDELALVRRLGIADGAPVTHEGFRQWVIEDRFAAGRPPLEAAGATFTDDVEPYETMKLHLLNAGHQVLANAGELLSVATIADCMAHPVVAPFFRHVMGAEVAPHVEPTPERDAGQYLDLVSRRFANPLIRDTVRRVAHDGSSRHPGFVLPSVRAALRAGDAVEGLALAEALWARMCAGTREDGSAIEPNDPHWPARHAAALAAREAPLAWLAQRDVYDDLADAEAFVRPFERSLRDVWENGVEAAIGRYAG